MRIGNQEIKELQVINTENDLIVSITDDDVIVEFGNNKNCRIPMQKSAITQLEKPEA